MPQQTAACQEQTAACKNNNHNLPTHRIMKKEEGEVKSEVRKGSNVNSQHAYYYI
jgi:hypothetical protein